MANVRPNRHLVRELSEIGIRYIRQDNYVEFVDPYLDPLPSNAYYKLADPGSKDTTPFYTFNRVAAILKSDYYAGKLETSKDAARILANLNPGDILICYDLIWKDFVLHVKQGRTQLFHSISLYSLNLNTPDAATKYMSVVSSTKVQTFFLSLDLHNIPLPLPLSDNTRHQDTNAIHEQTPSLAAAAAATCQQDNDHQANKNIVQQQAPEITKSASLPAMTAITTEHHTAEITPIASVQLPRRSSSSSKHWILNFWPSKDKDSATASKTEPSTSLRENRPK